MFSVVIPYYKKRRYIERCLDSVYNQSFKDFEIILVDDGSNDDIAELIEQKYPQVKLIQQSNQGVSAARNKGIANAIHEYIAFLDADDCWGSSYLDYAAKVIDENIDVKIIGYHYTRDLSTVECDSHSIDYFRFENYFKEAIRNTYFTSSSTIINRKFFQQNPGFNSNLKRGEDIDVWIRAVASGGNAFYVRNTLVYYSDEDENQVTKSVSTLEHSIIHRYCDLYSDLIERNKAFRRFISYFIYLNLFPYYFSIKNHTEARYALQKIPYKVFLMQVVYVLPFSIGLRLSNSKSASVRVRQYLKFIARVFN